ERPLGGLPLRLGEVLVEHRDALLVDLAGELVAQQLQVDALVPGLEAPHRRQPAHLLAVLHRRGLDGEHSLLAPELAVARRDLEARDEALDVPFPWPR